MKLAFLSLLILHVSLIGRATVFAQSVSVDLRLITPVAEVRTGGDAQLRCSFIGVSLNQSPIVEWRKPNKTLVWHGTPYVNNIVVGHLAQNQATGVISQQLDISRLQLSDTGTYICNVRTPQDGGGSRIDATDSVYLNVTESYFPASGPLCTPDGPLTVSVGDVVPTSCVSKLGLPTVKMTLHRNLRDVTETFVAMETDGNLVRSLDLTVSSVDNRATYKCSITSLRYFPDLEKTCTIGPFTVLEIMKTSTASSQTPLITTSTSEETTVSLVSGLTQNSQATTVIALAVSLGALLILCLVSCAVLFAPPGFFESKKTKRSRVPSITRVHPKPNAYDGGATGLEVFTTREGVTDYAFAITNEDKADWDTCNIPMYSVVMSSTLSRNQDTQNRQSSAIVSDPDLRSSAIGSDLDQRSSAIGSDQARLVTDTNPQGHTIIADVEINKLAIVADGGNFVTVSDPDSGFPTMSSDEEMHAQVDVSSVPQEQVSQPLESLPPPPPPPPPPPYFPRN